MSRTPLLLATTLTLTAVVIAAVLLGLRRPSPLGTPNVVLIIIDTLRADRLGCYGYSRPTSPHLDRIAEGGVLFETAIANSSWTRPSLASLLTGTYPRQTGVYKERFDVLSPEVPTLAATLRGHGYTTIGITANPTVNSVFGFDQGFLHWRDSGVLWPWMQGRRDRRFVKGSVEMDDAAEVTDRALEAVQRLAAEPFYLQLLYIDPHLPYSAPSTFDHELNRGARTDSERYDAEVAFVDAQVGRLLDRLLHTYPDTLVVVTSDHGEGLDDHPGVARARTHGYTLYDSVLRIPLIFHHPALASGTRFGNMVQLLDVMPTICDLLGPSLEPCLQGTSLAPILVGRPAPELPRQVFSDTQYKTVDKISVREQHHKLIVNRDHQAWASGQRPDLDRGARSPGARRRSTARAIRQCGPHELYQLPGAENPLEATNVKPASGDPELVRRLADAIAQFEARTKARPPQGRDRTREIDDSIIRQLEALGYLDAEESTPVPE